MERRIKRANISRATGSGTSGKGSISYRMQLPKPWMDKMGFTEDNLEAELSFDYSMNEIIIRKAKPDESNRD